MKKQYYIYISLGVTAIFLMQSLYISSLYNNFMIVEQQNIENTIYEAIDLEMHHRRTIQMTPNHEVKYKTAAKFFDEFSKSEQDSLIEIYPFLAEPPKEIKLYDIRELMDRGIIRSSEEIAKQKRQDRLREEGYAINIHILDSLFKTRLDRDYESRLYLTDSLGQVVCTEGDLIKYNHTSRNFAIGVEGIEFVVANVNIKLSRFIISSIATLVLSFLTLSISLFTLIYLATNLRLKAANLRRRETMTNGIIHDLKSPVVAVSAMLDLFRMLESDAEKVSIIEQNQHSVALLNSRIERLLKAVKEQIEIKKELLTTDQLIERTNILTGDLKRRYSCKQAEIVIVCDDDLKTQSVNIDPIYFDGAIVNLVENALRYSGDNISINVVMRQDHDSLHVTVEDNGLGIAKGEHNKIFDYLYSVNKEETKGSGIGLAYTRATARAHGGDVVLVDSIIDKGSIFKVSFNIR